MTIIRDEDFGPCERATVPDALPFIQARNYTRTNVRQIDLIVLHTMEAAEKPGTAKAVARWFAGELAPQASAHYCIDDKDTIQCVKDGDVAWAAPGTNHNGIQIEHAGYAAQTMYQWNDAYSAAMLQRSAKLVARLCEQYAIPVEFVDAAGLLEGDRGITVHAAVSLACRMAQSRKLTTSPFFNKRKNVPLTTHTDPGASFPMDEYLDLVRRS